MIISTPSNEPHYMTPREVQDPEGGPYRGGGSPSPWGPRGTGTARRITVTILGEDYPCIQYNGEGAPVQATSLANSLLLQTSIAQRAHNPRCPASKWSPTTRDTFRTSAPCGVEIGSQGNLHQSILSLRNHSKLSS